MASNTIEVNDAVNVHNFIEVLVVNLKTKVDEIKKLKDLVRALERKLASETKNTSVKSEQCVFSTSEHKDCTCYSQKQSNPEVFQFPAPNSDVLGTKDTCVIVGTEHRNVEIICDTAKECEEVWNLVDHSKEPALVPEQDFKNAINELIKTKTLLHNSQKNQKAFTEDLKLELHELRQKNEKLEKDLKKLEAEKFHSSKQIAPLKGDKFELNEDLSHLLENSNEHSSLSVSVTLKTEIDELKLENKMLKEENKMKITENLGLVKKVKTMQKEIDGLKEIVKTLQISLQEEKDRSSKAISNLNSMKQAYEKNAMEKARSLEQRPGLKYNPNPGGRLFSSETQHSGTTNCSSEIVGTTPGAATSNGSYNIMPDLRQARPATQNNLSPQPFERKPSNLPQSPSSIKQCPRCLAEFGEDEDTYMKHLHKCINCD